MCMLGGARPAHAGDSKLVGDGGADCALLDKLDKLDTSRYDVGERGATCDTRVRTAREGCERHCAAIDIG